MSQETAIRQMIQQWSAATNQPGDAGADGYVSFVTEDVVLLPPHGERVNGRDALRAWSLDFTGAEDWSVSWAADSVEVAESGELAHAFGSYQFRMRDEDGNLVEDRGTFLDTFRKQPDGSWKATVIAFNSDLPVEPE